MSADARNLKKVYTQVTVRPRATPVRKFAWGLAGSVLSPAYWLMAYRHRSPGLQFRLQCARMGLRLLCNPRCLRLLNLIYLLLFWPMDSTRYFECDFMWSALSGSRITRYLDVSSPRLFPVILANTHQGLAADLMNPDPKEGSEGGASARRREAGFPAGSTHGMVPSAL